MIHTPSDLDHAGRSGCPLGYVDENTCPLSNNPNDDQLDLLGKIKGSFERIRGPDMFENEEALVTLRRKPYKGVILQCASEKELRNDKPSTQQSLTRNHA